MGTMEEFFYFKQMKDVHTNAVFPQIFLQVELLSQATCIFNAFCACFSILLSNGLDQIYTSSATRKALSFLALDMLRPVSSLLELPPDTVSQYSGKSCWVLRIVAEALGK